MKATAIETDQQPADLQEASTLLPEKSGRRARPFQVTHGAYRLVRSFYAGTLDMRGGLAKLSQDLRTGYARHCGYDAFNDCPITLQTKITLVVGNQLFLMTFLPEPGSKTGGRDIRASENTLNRILNELGLKRTERLIPALDDVIEIEQVAPARGNGDK